MNLFQSGDFTLASGQVASWKIECDALTDDDWRALAKIIAKQYLYHAVTGVPRGGAKLAQMILAEKPPVKGCRNHLIVDDVYTTGDSINRIRDAIMQSDQHPGLNIWGCVVFARAPINPRDRWVSPIFQFWR